jgi:type II secretory pathway component PulK
VRRRRGRRQRGVALVLVTVAVSIGALLTVEFETNTRFDAFGADNSLDQMRGEMLARSSLNLSELIIRLQQVLDNPQVKQQIGAIQITDYADMFMSAFGGDRNEVRGMLGAFADSDGAKGFGAEIGSFGVRISSDDGKINVNCANGKPEHRDLVYTLLEALYFFPAYDRVFEEPDADGWRRDRRQQTEAIIDFIDEDRDRAPAPGEPKGGAGEDYGYENLPDRYQAKNGYLDTIDEIKLIRGVDERFWTLFGPAFTVYGGCQLNIRALEDPRIIAAILYLTAKDREDPVIRDGARLWYHALAVSFARQSGIPFETTQELVDFVKDPEERLQNPFGLDPQAAGTPGLPGAPAQPVALQIPGVPPGIDLGLELDPAAVNRVLRAGPQRTYRVEAWGQVTRHEVYPPILRHLTAVWDMGNVNSNQRSQDPKARNGAWVYARIH